MYYLLIKKQNFSLSFSLTKISKTKTSKNESKNHIDIKNKSNAKNTKQND